MKYTKKHALRLICVQSMRGTSIPGNRKRSFDILMFSMKKFQKLSDTIEHNAIQMHGGQGQEGAVIG